MSNSPLLASCSTPHSDTTGQFSADSVLPLTQPLGKVLRKTCICKAFREVGISLRFPVTEEANKSKHVASIVEFMPPLYAATMKFSIVSKSLITIYFCGSQLTSSNAWVKTSLNGNDIHSLNKIDVIFLENEHAL